MILRLGIEYRRSGPILHVAGPRDVAPASFAPVGSAEDGAVWREVVAEEFPMRGQDLRRFSSSATVTE